MSGNRGSKLDNVATFPMINVILPSIRYHARRISPYPPRYKLKTLTAIALILKITLNFVFFKLLIGAKKWNYSDFNGKDLSKMQSITRTSFFFFFFNLHLVTRSIRVKLESMESLRQVLRNCCFLPGHSAFLVVTDHSKLALMIAVTVPL